MSETLAQATPLPGSGEPADSYDFDIDDLRWEEQADPIFDPYIRFDGLPSDGPRPRRESFQEDIDETYDHAVKMADLAIGLMINGGGKASDYIGKGNDETWRIHNMAKRIVRIKLLASLARSTAMAATESNELTAAGSA